MCQTTLARREERELNLEEIAQLADILAEMKIAILVLTGGEPLLRDDLVEIVKLFSRQGISVRLQTNAVLADQDKVQDLLAAGLEEVTISLHSLYPEVNDRLTRVDGSWFKIMKGLANFIEFLPTRGNLSGINVTVSKYNIRELPALVRFISFMGFNASLIPVHLTESDNQRFIIRAYSPECSLNQADYGLIDEVYDELIKMKKEHYLIYNSFRFLRESREFLKTGRINWTCRSPDLYFSISPQGNFLPCVDIKTDNSMLRPDFMKNYRSGGLKEETRRLARNCPGCMYACYPEIVYICTDPVTFLERVIFSLRSSRKILRKRSYDELLQAAEEFRSQ